MINQTQKIQKGYKKTEVGVIPEDWEVEKLGKVLSKKRLGGNYRNQDSMARRALIKMGNVGRGTIDLEKIEYIPDNVTVSQKDKLKYGDLLFNTRNTLDLVGKVAIWRDELNNAFYNSNLLRLKFKKDFIASNFFANYLFNSKQSIAQLKSFAIGTTSVAAIYTRDLLRYRIVIPPLVEQTAIASVLSDVDELIENLDKLISKKKKIKQRAMQELLTGKRRLPGFEQKKGYKKTEVGVIPEDWEVKKLEELGLISGSGANKKVVTSEIYVKLLNYMDVYRRDFIDGNKIKQVVTTPFSKKNKCSIEKGDIFFTPSSEVPDDIARSAVSIKTLNGIVYSYHLVRLRLDCDWDLKFRGYVFKTDTFYRQAKEFCQGSGTRYVIPLSKFRDITVAFTPNKQEQTAIASVLSDMDQEIETLQKKKQKYQKIKKGMMQQLLTGKIRLI